MTKAIEDMTDRELLEEAVQFGRDFRELIDQLMESPAMKVMMG